MATVAHTATTGTVNKGKVCSVGALTGAGTDVSDAIDLGTWKRASVQSLAGTFGTTTLTAQVSNDGSTWATAKDIFGNDLTFTAVGLKSLALGARYLRIAAPSGNGTGLTTSIFLSL